MISSSRTRELAVTCAERLRVAAHRAQLFTDVVQGASPTISFGVAAFPHDAHSPDELLSAADAALYQAKRAGRNRVACASCRA